MAPHASNSTFAFFVAKLQFALRNDRKLPTLRYFLASGVIFKVIRWPARMSSTSYS
jgi:hypothetical protein